MSCFRKVDHVSSFPRAFHQAPAASRLSPSPPKDCKLAVVARSDLRMSAGKLAAQAGDSTEPRDRWTWFRVPCPIQTLVHFAWMLGL